MPIIGDTIGEHNCFSHTGRYAVNAGPQFFYAIAQNYVDLDGNGRASIYGRLTVEYTPQSSGVLTAQSNTDSYFNGLLPIAYDSVTILAPGPGKVEVRLNGIIDLRPGDVIVAAISDTKNWDYTDPYGIALKADLYSTTYEGISTTWLFHVPAAGSYTFYAMGHRHNTAVNGPTSLYGHLFVKHIPEAEVTSPVSAFDLPFEIYSNPAHDHIRIQSPIVNDNLTLEIFNIDGIRVIQTKVYDTEGVQIPSLNAGMYFVKLTNGKEAGIRKIVIQ